jgi:hypothetical protein
VCGIGIATEHKLRNQKQEVEMVEAQAVVLVGVQVGELQLEK